MKMEALLGKSGRASKLVEQYENCVSQHHSNAAVDNSSPDDCEREMRFWIQIGAENGDLDMMGVRFNDYFAGISCNDTYRAKFWLDKIIKLDKSEPWISMERAVKIKISKCSS